MKIENIIRNKKGINVINKDKRIEKIKNCQICGI